MRLPISISFGVFLLLVRGLAAQQDMRPAVMKPGPTALINVIDAEQLFKRGQGDAIVRFDFGVDRTGQAYGTDTYLRSDKSDLFAHEIVDKMERSKWIPAVWHGETVYCTVSATGIFAVVDGKPRVRIYLNQEEDHLKHGDDFIAPQPTFSHHDHFTGFFDPNGGRFSGLASAKIQVDATGKLVGAKVSGTKSL